VTESLKDFLFIDQLKVMGYGESDTSGCWIKFQLTPELLEVVRGRKGEMVEVAARLIDNSGEYVPPSKKDESGRHGKFWYGLIRHGVFNAPPVLEAIGTDAEFQEWIRRQPSCISGDQDWIDGLGEGRCECAHVRRVGEGSGTAIKPPYFAVPLTHREHAIQHQHGESALEATEYFEKKATHYRTEWASKKLAESFGYESRKECPPETVLMWAENADLLRNFPAKLKEVA